MSYYYATRDGSFTDSTRPISDPNYIRLNEQQYHIARLIIMGYSRREIESAVDVVFSILESGITQGNE